METDPIILDFEDGIAIIKLNRGTTNAINPDLVASLTSTLRDLKQDGEVHGLVLSSSNEKFFSIGFDIPYLFDLPPESFRNFYQSFGRLCIDLMTIPKPVISAIRGHAIAGGCILTLCCDYRVISEGHKLIGVNEIKLGVPVPFVADCILRRLIGYRKARDVMDGGDFYKPDEALRLGLVDKVLPSEEILTKSIEEARVLSSVSSSAFVGVKNNRVEPIEEEVMAKLGEKEDFFVECWYSDIARDRLKEAMAKF